MSQSFFSGWDGCNGKPFLIAADQNSPNAEGRQQALRRVPRRVHREIERIDGGKPIATPTKSGGFYGDFIVGDPPPEQQATAPDHQAEFATALFDGFLGHSAAAPSTPATSPMGGTHPTVTASAAAMFGAAAPGHAHG